jgi:Kef-type K+ transport system membrane component KefB
VSFGFGTLLVLVFAGLAGPVLAALGRGLVLPVVVGELLAGVLVGPQVLGAVDPSQPTVHWLGEIGFAMLMLSAGMHLPLRDERLPAALRDGTRLALLVVVFAVPAGLLASLIAGTGHAAVFATVLASGSAAVLLPAVEEAGLEGPAVMIAIAQVSVADVITIVSVPVVLQPSRIGHAALGAVLVAAAAVAVVMAVRPIQHRGWVRGLRRESKSRHWALDLRLSLLVLFALAWLAQNSGTSVLIAGFGAGLLVAAFGGPKRLSTQVRGVAEGFFVPIYFVVLGARLDLGGLFSEPRLLALLAALVGLNVAIHVLACMLLRRPPATALAASAQLGVPAAVASIGLAEHVISPGTATAIVASGLASLAVCSLGLTRMAREADQAGAGAGSSRGTGRPAAA